MIEIKVRDIVFTSLALSMPVTLAAGQQTAAPSRTRPVQVVAANQTSATQPQLQQRYPRYVIKRQDVLLVSFPLSPELNQTVTVQPDGYINLQGSGSVHVEGLTVPEMVEALKKAYVDTLNNPIIDVDLEDFQKPMFTVSGQVGKPGQYELRAPTTVAEAIAVAGGLQPTAKTQVFLFHKANNDWFQVEKLNLKDVLDGKKVNEDATIQPGDMVFVPEKFIANFKKYVPYTVNAGTYIQPSQF
ncbi:MAG TPA: polysaccharide biosynthesis/export family protein [Terriglobia bacterium]|nr:polysaccharide biosynthesis/export family protein [Terriglobia bacterium]